MTTTNPSTKNHAAPATDGPTDGPTPGAAGRHASSAKLGQDGATATATAPATDGPATSAAAENARRAAVARTRPQPNALALCTLAGAATDAGHALRTAQRAGEHADPETRSRLRRRALAAMQHAAADAAAATGAAFPAEIDSADACRSFAAACRREADRRRERSAYRAAPEPLRDYAAGYAAGDLLSAIDWTARATADALSALGAADPADPTPPAGDAPGAAERPEPATAGETPGDPADAAGEIDGPTTPATDPAAIGAAFDEATAARDSAEAAEIAAHDAMTTHDRRTAAAFDAGKIGHDRRAAGLYRSAADAAEIAADQLAHAATLYGTAARRFADAGITEAADANTADSARRCAGAGRHWRRLAADARRLAGQHDAAATAGD